MFDKIKKKGTIFIAIMFVFLIKVYTEIEYSFKKYILPYLPKHIYQTIFDFSENGNIICRSYSLNEMNENRKKFKCIDFALHKEYDKENEKYDSFVVDDLRNYSNNNFKKCKKHFMSVELSAYNKKYEIHMDRNNNYYIESNEVLFYEFVQYILYNEHSSYLSLDENYTITIVDNDCNIVTMDRTQYIKFFDNKYKIMTRKKYIKENVDEISSEIKNENNCLDEDEENIECINCDILLEQYRDGDVKNDFRCNNCYWEDEEGNNSEYIINPDYRNLNKENEASSEIENAIKIEEEIEIEKKNKLETIHEMELEEAEKYLELENKELEDKIESYYSDEEPKQQIFRCDNCETYYEDKVINNKIVLKRDGHYKNENTILCNDCYELNDELYQNRKWIRVE